MTSMMKGALLASALSASVALAAPASAQNYNFTFTSTYGSGSGVFTTTGTGNQLTVTGVTGTVDGYAITGLSPYASADQQLFFNAPSHFDVPGISFVSTAGTSYNFTSYPDSTDRLTNSVVDPGGFGTPTPAALSFSISAVPEPATWAMMLLGFGMVGVGLRRRVKQTVRVAYA